MTRLYDPIWQRQYLGADATWNVTFLHLIGHPLTPAEWDRAMEHKHQGLAPREALASLIGSQP